MSFQIDEIERANLKIGEEEELIKRRNLLSNAEKIYSSLANAYESLYQKVKAILHLMKFPLAFPK
ncbi:hypothetical protein [Caloramator sp. Dgby_cultured_2]|uniref:hypothetical protein n=1 Tax=Caloramator sp. Dgby_cultured_2 TaxID=3029174 RepID=UPI00237D634A|nr:hypothetical protein [Caloramator sp. Dgby_cultured_2]WDU84263.1 hypothetical protein PWK10_08145 [Caloramator sp. Dgby_cultured_2]